MSDDKVASLKKVSLFADLPDDLLNHLVDKLETHALSKGSFLFHEGDKGDALFIIQAGELEIFKGEAQDPQRQILAKLGTGEYLGEMALLENKPRSASAWALADCTLLSLKREDFNELLQRNPLLALKLTATISARLRTFMDTTTPAKAKKKSADLSKTRVFISYSRRDKQFVKLFYEAITNEGINAWIDWENIPLTADWWDEIERGIKGADAFIYIISPDSVNATSVCLREIEVGNKLNKRIVPILYREVPKGLEIPKALADANWVWMRDEAEMRANLSDMLAVINTDLEWVREHTRLLARALEWDTSKRNNNLLLRGPDLVAAQAWIAKAGAIDEPKPLPIHGEYIQASQKDAAFRQRVTRGIGIAFILLMLIATIVSSIGFTNATKNQYAAQTAQYAAQAAQADANSNLVKANVANTEAAENLVAAQAANTQAAENLAIAQLEANRALARNLASQALSKNNVDHPLALLLGVEAFIKDPSSQARSALFEILQFMPYHPLFGHPASVAGVAYSNGTIASASCGVISVNQCLQGEIILWDARTKSPLQKLTGDFGQINSLAFSPDGKILAAGGCVAFEEKTQRGGCLDQKGQITLWDINSNKATLRQIISAGHTGPVTSIAFSPDGEYLASGSFDKSIIMWKVGADFQQDGSPLGGPDGHTSFVNSVAFSPDSSTLASGGDDRQIILWNVKAYKVVRKLLNAQRGAISCVAFSPDGSMLASGSYDKTIALWNLDTHENKFSVNGSLLIGHTGYVTSLAFNAAGTRLVSGSFDKSVIVWDVASHQPEGLPLARHTKPVNAVVFDNDDRVVISGSDDKTIILWDLAARPQESVSRPIVTGLPTLISALSTNADGSVLFALGSDRKVYAWNVISRARQSDIQSNAALFRSDKSIAQNNSGSQVNIQPDNSLFLSGAGTSLKGHTGVVNSIAFSADGKMLASASVDQTIILWDVFAASPTFGQITQVLTGHTGAVLDAVFTPDGKTLISVGDDQMIITWNLDTDAWLQAACAAARRTLTADERQQFLGDAAYETFCK